MATPPAAFGGALLAGDSASFTNGNPNAVDEIARPLSSLSTLSKVFIGCITLYQIYQLAIHPAAGASILVLWIPSVILFMYWRRFYRHAELDRVVRLFATGFLPGALFAMLIQLMIVIGILMITLSGQFPDWKRAYENYMNDDRVPLLIVVKKSMGFYVFIWSLAFIGAACTEEMMKYTILQRIRQYRPTFRDWRGYLLYAVTGALGFSTVENIGYSLNEEGINVLWTALQRIVLSTPLHIACAYLIGVGVVKRDCFDNGQKLWRILALPVAFHGSFDFVLFMIYINGRNMSEATGNGISIAGCVCMLIMLLVSCRWEYQSLRYIVDVHTQPREPLTNINVVPSGAIGRPSVVPSAIHRDGNAAAAPAPVVPTPVVPNDNNSNGNDIRLGSPREIAAILAAASAAAAGAPPPPPANNNARRRSHDGDDDDDHDEPGPSIEDSLRAIATHRHLTNLGLV